MSRTRTSFMRAAGDIVDELTGDRLARRPTLGTEIRALMHGGGDEV